MKSDLRTNTSVDFPRGSKVAKRLLVDLLERSAELETNYQGYAQLRSVVGKNAWRSLTDHVFGQILELNLRRGNADLLNAIEQNMIRLQDITDSMAIHDDAALRETLSRVLTFRLINGLSVKPSQKSLR